MLVKSKCQNPNAKSMPEDQMDKTVKMFFLRFELLILDFI